MADIQEGQTATNPKTGQKIVYKGGQWHSAAAGPSSSTAAPPQLQLTGDARNLSLQKIESLNALRKQAVIAAQMYNKNFSRESGRSSMSEYVPSAFSDTNAQYDAALDGLAPLARAAFRVPGSGADSDKESETFMNTTPTRYTNDAGAKQKYQQMLQYIDGAIGGQKQLLGIAAAKKPTPPANRMGQFKVIR